MKTVFSASILILEPTNLPREYFKEDYFMSENSKSKGPYILKRKPDKKTVWAFGVAAKKLDKYLNDNLVLRCDFKASNESFFQIPVSHLKLHILNDSRLNCCNGSYKFEINKKTHIFNWHRKVKMKGNPFFYAKTFNNLPTKSLCNKTTNHDNSIKPLKFIEAAYKILKEKGQPLTAKQIKAIVREKKLITRQLHNTLYMDINIKGSKSRFIEINSGVFGLKEWRNKLNTKYCDQKDFVKKMELLEKRISNLEKVITKSCQSILGFIRK